MAGGPIRVGLMGCASVAGYALFDAIAGRPDIRVDAVASRSAERARAYAAQHRIPRSYGSYQALLEDGALDLVYIPLPSALHAEWSIAALKAGLPVLCEKPIASNLMGARAMEDAARETGVALLEAIHWRYHPLADRLADHVKKGTVGRITAIEAWFLASAEGLTSDNFRLDYALGGGAMLDMGCYCMSLLRMVAGAEPEVVVSAQCQLARDQVDNEMEARLRFPAGFVARLHVSMHEPDGSEYRIGARITGEHGSIEVVNPFLPNLGSSITIRRHGVAPETETFTSRSSYAFQADALVAFLRGENNGMVGPSESIANMAAIDAVYEAAGLRVRP